MALIKGFAKQNWSQASLAPVMSLNGSICPNKVNKAF